jgi:hypothetical protein
MTTHAHERHARATRLGARALVLLALAFTAARCTTTASQGGGSSSSGGGGSGSSGASGSSSGGSGAGVALAVNHASIAYALGSGSPQYGDFFVVVDLTLRNIDAKSPVPTLFPLFSIRTNQALVVGARESLYGCNAGVSVDTGGQVECSLAFEMPVGQTPVTVTYDDHLGDQASSSVPALAGNASSGGGGTGSGSSGGTPAPTVDDFPGCAADSSLACAGASIGISCPSGTNPNSASYACSSPIINPDGTVGYCCIWFPSGGGCAPDPSVTGCLFPSYGFSCSVPGDTPDTFDCTLNCSVDNGSGTFCCVDNGVCGAGNGGSSSGGSTCVADLSLSCDPGTDGVDCPAGRNPEMDLPGYLCSNPSPQSDGTDGYCCATGFSGSTCMQNSSVPGCVYPTIGFSCTGSDTPDMADPSLTCSAPVTDPTTGDPMYCCE